LDSPIKVLLMENSHPSLEVPGKGASPPCSPKWGLCGKRHPFPEPYCTYPSRSPVNEPSLQFPPTERERDALFQDPSFIHLSESLGYEPPPYSPMGP